VNFSVTLLYFFWHPLIVSHCYKKIWLAVDTRNELLDKMLDFRVHFRSIDNLGITRYAPTRIMPSNFQLYFKSIDSLEKSRFRLQLTTANGLPWPLPCCVAAWRQWDQINQSFCLTCICRSSALFRSLSFCYSVWNICAF
jgi:hypothetical protein